MKISKIILHNFKRFENQDIDFHDNLTIFFGNNGAGKTTVLEAVQKSLSWVVARILSENSNGHQIYDEEIKNGENASYIKSWLGDEVHFTIAKNRKGRKRELTSDFRALRPFVDTLREELSNNPKASLPLMVYYPTERTVIDIPLRIKTSHSFEQIDGYDNALRGGAEFKRFFEWFRLREDIENERSDDFEQRVSEYLSKNETLSQDVLEKLKSEKDHQLSAVRSAIYRIMPDFSNLRVRRKSPIRMLVDKNGEPFEVGQLSQGEKSLMALVGDLARRLAMMNPQMLDPLQGEGIVLLDEVDLHLHPKWQRQVLENLRNTFPNCQFIITTHSPQVLGEAKDADVYLLDMSVKNNIQKVSYLFGQDTNQILEEFMNAASRNTSINTQISSIFESIQSRDFGSAESRLVALEEILGQDSPELVKARMTIKKLRLLHAKNS
jgi:predicted ATP-binding protein involved in virulence